MARTGSEIDDEGGARRRPQSFGVRRIGMILVGLIGVAILVGLCVWQVQRLGWKNHLIDTLEARLAAPPTRLPAAFDPESQEFTRVTITGHFDGRVGKHGFPDAPLLSSRTYVGPGYRVIQPFTTNDGRVVMVDRGFVPIAEKNSGGAATRPTPAPDGEITLTGALRWPDETGDGPAHGARDNIWTARDLDEMSRLFGAEKVLVIAETSTAVGDWPVAEPLRAVNIRNNHLEYAITWGLLALVWAVMTGYLIFRRPDAEEAG